MCACSSVGAFAAFALRRGQQQQRVPALRAEGVRWLLRRTIRASQWRMVPRCCCLRAPSPPTATSYSECRAGCRHIHECTARPLLQLSAPRHVLAGLTIALCCSKTNGNTAWEGGVEPLPRPDYDPRDLPAKMAAMNRDGYVVLESIVSPSECRCGSPL